MKTPVPLDAVTAWNTLGMQWMEMMAASGQAFAHRAQRSNTPAQLYDMGSEKFLAAMESSNAMARGMIGFPSSDPLAAWQAWTRVLSSGMAPYRRRAVRNARSARRSR